MWGGGKARIGDNLFSLSVCVCVCVCVYTRSPLPSRTYLEVVVGDPAVAHRHGGLSLARRHALNALELHVRHGVTPILAVDNPRRASFEVLFARQEVHVQRAVILLFQRWQRLGANHDGVVAALGHRSSEGGGGLRA
jgi:hypothetical protein